MPGAFFGETHRPKPVVPRLSEGLELLLGESQRRNMTLFGANVTAVTDHNPLKFFTLMSHQSARLMRWALALQRFNVMIVYKKGKFNPNVDALSRLSSSHSVG